MYPVEAPLGRYVLSYDYRTDARQCIYCLFQECMVIVCTLHMYNTMKRNRKRPVVHQLYIHSKEFSLCLVKRQVPLLLIFHPFPRPNHPMMSTPISATATANSFVTTGRTCSPPSLPQSSPMRPILHQPGNESAS